ncbi:MAG: sugar phosphate isomerase/epimerase [Candidatus Solibacter usitatus]|nr:sugar phosphate isomerase/epimerase [Candidatus Solibacter usitatus]
MMLGAVTYNTLKDWTLDQIVEKLPPLGFHAVELRTTHKHGVEIALSKAEREKVREKFSRSKLRLLSYGTTCEFHSADPAVRRKNVDETKQWVELAHDTGAWGVKVRPNGFAKELGPEKTIQMIGESLRECAEYGARMGVEIWLEVHGRETQPPDVAAAIMRAANHKNVGLCWNSNPTDVVNGSVKKNFELLRPWLKSCHINELAGPYPYRELFALMRASKYDRFTLCEAQASPETERFLRWYNALWTELGRACA